MTLMPARCGGWGDWY